MLLQQSSMQTMLLQQSVSADMLLQQSFSADHAASVYLFSQLN